MIAFSFGGGVQSMACLVLAARGRLDCKVFLFANVGTDSENPDTLDYVNNYSIPFARDHGIEFHELRRSTKKYPDETLYQRLIREERSIRIPVRQSGNGAPGTRWCTEHFKIAVIRKWLGTGNHTVLLGISLDEMHRARTHSGFDNITNEYPLIDRRLNRRACAKIISDEGLPVPPKSSCWFCPLHSTSQWQEMKRARPALFDSACELEKKLNDKRTRLKRDPVFMSQKQLPLGQVIGDQPLLFEEFENCDSGHCFT